MAGFQSKKFRGSAGENVLAAKYRVLMQKHPFLLFGFPFLATMVAGSFFLTPATALRYERHDRKVRTMSKEEELGLGQDRRRVDMKEEYYVSSALAMTVETMGTLIVMVYRDWPPRTWTTGSKSASRDFPASTTESFEANNRSSFICYSMLWSKGISWVYSISTGVRLGNQ